MHIVRGLEIFISKYLQVLKSQKIEKGQRTTFGAKVKSLSNTILILKCLELAFVVITLLFMQKKVTRMERFGTQDVYLVPIATKAYITSMLKIGTAIPFVNNVMQSCWNEKDADQLL